MTQMYPQSELKMTELFQHTAGMTAQGVICMCLHSAAGMTYFFLNFFIG